MRPLGVEWRAALDSRRMIWYGRRMTQRVACPHCGKQFAARPEMLGRKVRCSGCGSPFVAEEMELDLADLEQAGSGTPVTTAVGTPATAQQYAQQPARAAAYAPPGAAPSAYTPSAYTPPAPPRVKRALSPQEQHTRDVSRRQAVRLGRYMVVLGVLALLLPLVGLQLRIVNQLGQAGFATGTAAVLLFGAGITFWVLGATEAGGTFLLHGLKWAKRILLTVLILLALLVGFGLFMAFTSHPSNTSPYSTPGRR